MARECSLGVVNSGTALDEVLLEMLEHQGIPYEEVERKGGKSYSTVLLATDDSDSLATARRSCAYQDGILVVDKSIDLRRVLRCLGGLEERRVDRLEFVVNDLEVKLVELVAEALSATNSSLIRKSFWPGKAPACCVITSDVDWLTYSPFHAAVAKGGLSPMRLAGLAYGSLTGKNYGMNFDVMLQAQGKYNYKSTVFLRAQYEKGSENLAGAVSLLKDAGFEIGLHGSDGAHLSSDSLRAQLEVIASMTGTRPRGVRHHILKMNIPTTWEIESSAGLDYDATFSYNRFFGFRGDVCFPYHPFASRRLPLLELPTSFMDWTALKRGVRGREAEKVLDSIMERVEHYHGLLVVNFHNTYLNRETFPDILGLYERLIDHISERGYWVTTASACTEWWRKRAAAKLYDAPEGIRSVISDGVQIEVIDGKGPSASTGARD